MSNILLSPLRDIPGPLPANLSPLRMGLIDFIALRSTFLLQLHERYGDIVPCSRAPAARHGALRGAACQHAALVSHAVVRCHR
jgi:hypothetical protein